MVIKKQGKSAQQAINEVKVVNGNKVEPKFKVGDWVVDECNGNVSQVISVDTDVNGYELSNGNYFSGSWTDSYHLWTIEDAKDGDVLVSASNQPFIYNGHYTYEMIGAYCGVESRNLTFLLDDEPCYWTYNSYITPATKEQKELLFNKMKEDGYEWDSELRICKRHEVK